MSNNKEWLEIKLTSEQLDLLENYNIVSGNRCSYILSLGEFYKLIYDDNFFWHDKHYMTTDIKLLPDYVQDVYKEIITNQYKKLNNE